MTEGRIDGIVGGRAASGKGDGRRWVYHVRVFLI